MKNHKKLERLMLFSEVAQHLSFTDAAKTLGISRGHLSTQIKALEKEMSLILFVRSTRSVRLTVEGHRVLEGMKQVRMTLLEIERDTQHSSAAIEGLIKITAPNLFCQSYLLDLINEFRKLYPSVKFSVDTSYKSFDLIESDFDLAFRSTNNPPHNMIAKPLMKYKHQCYAAPSYLEQKGTPNSPSDLRDHCCMTDNNNGSWAFDTLNIEMENNSWLEINDHNQLKQMAIRGQGIIKIAEYAVTAEVINEQLVPVLASFESELHSLQLIYPQLTHRSSRVTRFLQFVQQNFVSE